MPDQRTEHIRDGGERRARSARRAGGTLLGLLCGLLLSAAASTAAAAAVRDASAAQQKLAVSIQAAHPGATIPPDFLGLSLETPTLGQLAIGASSGHLAGLLRNLGPGVLRIGGDSVDRTQWLATPAPRQPWSVATISPADLRNLAALMQASGWRLILGADLGHLDVASVVEEAQAAGSILGGSLAGFTIGNEPDLYAKPPPAPYRATLGSTALRPHGWGLGAYEAEIKTVRAALSAAGVSLPIYGPEVATGEWLARYARDEGSSLTALTAHVYPLDRCKGGVLLHPGPSSATLLGQAVTVHESRQIAGLVRDAASRRLPLRIDELGSVACGGQPGVSDTFAAALWAVDAALIAGREGAAGVNFSAGIGSCREGGTLLSPWYSPLCAQPEGRLTARPDYYALLLLHSLEGCAFLPVAYRSSPGVSIYALRAPDGSLRVVVDDRESAAGRTQAHRAPLARLLALSAGSAYSRASVEWLSAPSVGARTGVTLGGAALQPGGQLAQPASEALRGAAGSFALTLRPASVALVTLSR